MKLFLVDFSMWCRRDFRVFCFSWKSAAFQEKVVELLGKLLLEGKVVELLGKVL